MKDLSKNFSKKYLGVGQLRIFRGITLNQKYPISKKFCKNFRNLKKKIYHDLALEKIYILVYRFIKICKR